MDPNVFIVQQPPPKPTSRFKPPLTSLIIFLSFLAILIVGLIFSPKGKQFMAGLSKPVSKLTSVDKNAKHKVNQDLIEAVFKEAAITTFIVNPKSTASFVKLEKTRIHLPTSLSTPPKEASGSFIFKADIISKSGSVLYSSWKKFPIVKPQKDGSFEVKVLTPYQKDYLLRLKDTQGKVILTRFL